MSVQGYYATPTVQGDALAFLCEEDLWLTRFEDCSRDSGAVACAMPQRLTVEGSAASPALSPDGRWLAFSCDATSTYEVHVMPAAGGEAWRLTHFGADSVICGWTPDSRAILFHSNAGCPMEHERAVFCVSVDGGAPTTVPVGPATHLSRDPGSDREFLARHADDAHLSEWKGYQGGRVAQIWVRSGQEAPWKRLALPAQPPPRHTINPSSPAWWRGRIAFISDHSGRGNVYSVTASGDGLAQHSFHTEYYARNLSGDGSCLVWQHGGDVWRLVGQGDDPQRVMVPWQSPRQLRAPRHVPPSAFLEEVALSSQGRYITVITRGQAHAMPPHGGPGLRVGPTQGRVSDPSYRANGSMVFVSDASGEAQLCVAPRRVTCPGDHERKARRATDSESRAGSWKYTPPTVAAQGEAPHDRDTAGDSVQLRIPPEVLGQPQEVSAAPRGSFVAVSNHRGELLGVDLRPTSEGFAAQAGAPSPATPEEQWYPYDAAIPPELAAALATDTRARDWRGGGVAVRVLDRAFFDGGIDDLEWHPNGRWVAYSVATGHRTSAIRLCHLPTGAVVNATRGSFQDTCPTFDPRGDVLYFLSARDYCPVPDDQQFAFGFPQARRPYLVTLRRRVGNPLQQPPMAPWESDSSSSSSDSESESDNESDLDKARTGDRRPRGDGPSRKGAASASSGEDDDDADGDDDSDEEEEEEEEGSQHGITVEGLCDRIIALPAPVARYTHLSAIRGRRVLYVREDFAPRPVSGEGGEEEEDEDEDEGDGEPAAGTLHCLHLRQRREACLMENVLDLAVSADARTMAVMRDDGDGDVVIHVLPAGGSSDGEDWDLDEGELDTPGRTSGLVDLDGRVTLVVEPPLEWRQMVDESWRTMRDHFYRPDMGGVDWVAVRARYLPLMARVACRSELSDVITEMQTELGVSHAFESGGDYPCPRPSAQGRLGVDVAWDGDVCGWRVEHVVTGDAWSDKACGPLARLGVDVRPGDVIVQVGGLPVRAHAALESAIDDHAGREVHLGVCAAADVARFKQQLVRYRHATARAEAAGAVVASDATATDQRSGDQQRTSGSRRRKQRQKKKGKSSVIVPQPLPARPVRVRCVSAEAERRARYRDWVERNAREVHVRTQGAAGYVHVPNMEVSGFAEFHRYYREESQRRALIVDVRGNAGGNVSELLLEKLTKRCLALSVPRYGRPEPYPQHAPAGPMCLIADEHTSSDGDIIAQSFRRLRLGPVIGANTWGGALGIGSSRRLVDGTEIAHPTDGFHVLARDAVLENVGVAPDHEVVPSPDDCAKGLDPQLDRAIEVIAAAVGSLPAAAATAQE